MTRSGGACKGDPSGLSAPFGAFVNVRRIRWPLRIATPATISPATTRHRAAMGSKAIGVKGRQPLAQRRHFLGCLRGIRLHTQEPPVTLAQIVAQPGERQACALGSVLKLPSRLGGKRIIHDLDAGGNKVAQRISAASVAQHHVVWTCRISGIVNWAVDLARRESQ